MYVWLIAADVHERSVSCLNTGIVNKATALSASWQIRDAEEVKK